MKNRPGGGFLKRLNAYKNCSSRPKTFASYLNFARRVTAGRYQSNVFGEPREGHMGKAKGFAMLELIPPAHFSWEEKGENCLETL